MPGLVILVVNLVIPILCVTHKVKFANPEGSNRSLNYILHVAFSLLIYFFKLLVRIFTEHFLGDIYFPLFK